MRAAMRSARWVLVAVIAFSFCVNLLILTGPLYMLQVYDRVLVSGSVETLVALTVLMVFLYLAMGLFDFLRGRIMARVALRLFTALQERVFHAVLRKSAVLPDPAGLRGIEDLETLQRLIAAPIVLAALDLPWAPLFFAAIFVFHPLLGALALTGGALLVLLTVANQIASHRGEAAASAARQDAQRAAGQLARDAQTVRALGMGAAGHARYARRQAAAQAGDLGVADLSGGFASLGKMLRLLLQSAMLGLGAWLVMGGKMTAGGMMAGSILLGRALSPIETVLAQWPMAQQGWRSRARLAELLGEVPAEPPRTALPAPRGHLRVEALTVVPPGERKPVLRGLSFAVAPGQAVGVIGTSGAGKSTLARALVGAWPATGGTIRLDGAALDQYGPEALGRHVGYLPQEVRLFDGTLAQNIARLAETPEEALLISAARQAGAHEMILSLPQGYDTPVLSDSPRLSGGQVQRIGLARALYGDPALVVLDEPNANLDNAGSEALNQAVRAAKAAGRAVLIMAHRPAAIRECDMILMLEGGARAAFGPREEVLSGMLRNAGALRAVPAVAGGMR